MSAVLIVDDEKNVLLTISIGLKRYQYTVLQAQSGPEALKVMDRSPCPFVVTDIRMSPMDGFTLADKIREKYPWVKLIFMSAYGSDILKEDKIKQYPFPRLTKPFEINQLVELLQEQTEGARWKEILVLGEKNNWEKIIGRFSKSGWLLHLLEDSTRIPGLLRRKSFQGFILDGCSTQDDMPQTLNSIDRWAPGRPVLLLAERSKGGDGKPEDISNVVKRDRFMQDHTWALKCLDRCFH
ncbi:MAG TPA: response regulator [bacterium]|nr:response regulator [bacterium]